MAAAQAASCRACMMLEQLTDGGRGPAQAAQCRACVMCAQLMREHTQLHALHAKCCMKLVHAYTARAASSGQRSSRSYSHQAALASALVRPQRCPCHAHADGHNTPCARHIAIGLTMPRTVISHRRKHSARAQLRLHAVAPAKHLRHSSHAGCLIP